MAEAQSSILIVDDDAEDLASVERALRSLGSELVSVKDPHEVLPSVHRHRPHVVILDALLPGLSGFDLCKQIKSDPQLKGTQVLILTGVYLRQQYRHEALQQFKADAFLTKPFRPPELQRIVVQLLARRTRMPQSTFLKRMGLPTSAEPRKRGLFGRIFGRGESEEEAESTRIAPLARDTAPPAAPEKPPEETPQRVEVAAVPEPMEVPRTVVAPNPEVIEEPPPAPTPQPDGSPAEPKLMPSEERLEAAVAVEVEPPGAAPPVDTPPMPEAVLETVPEPEPQEVPAPAPAPEEETPAPVGAVSDEGEPSASEELAAQPSPETEAVIWVEADTRTQDMTLDEVAARIADAETASKSEAQPTPSEPQTKPPEETPAPAEPPDSVPLRRPRFRVGDVPIYDESDFLSELKRELSKCKRVDRPLTLILIRVGDLGQIVELFGKDFREPVLWHIAEQAMESLREVDLVGMMSSRDLIAMTAFASDRYGGGRIVSRMRQAVSKKPFRVGDELPPIIPVLDFGMATFPADGSEVTSLIQRAEKDLSDGRVLAGSD